MSAVGSVRAASVNQPHPTAPSTIPFHKSLRSDDARGCEGPFYGLPASRRLPHGGRRRIFSLAEESENNESRKIYDEKGNIEFDFPSFVFEYEINWKRMLEKFSIRNSFSPMPSHFV